MGDRIYPVRSLGQADVLLGRQRDNAVRRILFDVSSWLAEYPDGRITASAKPLGGEVYPVALEMEGGMAVWSITDADTAKAGRGSIQLILLGPEGERLHSAIGYTLTLPSLDSAAGGEPPQSVAPWYEQVERALDGKLDKPPDAGKAGQVLGLDADKHPAWVDPPQGGGTGGAGLPIVDETDEGKVLTVVDGKWAAGELPKYDGAYSVTPDAEIQQTLQTAQKLMDADVVIAKIPYSEVSNTANGTTVIIG